MPRHWSLFRLSVLAILVIVCLLAIAEAGRDFYKILDVPKTANQKTIKKAYRKMSMKYHPDTNEGSKEAEAIFQDVAAAYEVLSNDEKRKIYDQYGEEGLEKHAQGQHGGGGGGDPFDIFSHFFGRRPQHREAKRGPDTLIVIPVTLEDLYVGTSVEVQVKQRVLCSHCHGSGAESEDDVSTCPHCKGQGVIMQVQQLAPGFVQRSQTTCPKCSGKGKVIKKQCHKCRGKGIESGVRTLDVFIDAGLSHGHMIQFDHAGDESPEHNAGHVVFKIDQQPHAFYTREGNDLKCEVTITLKESLIGFERHLTHLDGHRFIIRRTSVTKPNSVIKVKDEGFISTDGVKGTLHVKISVRFPPVLTSQQQKTIEELF